MTYFAQLVKNWSELCMSVINMNHLKDATKSKFIDRNF